MESCVIETDLYISILIIFTFIIFCIAGPWRPSYSRQQVTPIEGYRVYRIPRCWVRRSGHRAVRAEVARRSDHRSTFARGTKSSRQCAGCGSEGGHDRPDETLRRFLTLQHHWRDAPWYFWTVREGTLALMVVIINIEIKNVGLMVE